MYKYAHFVYNKLFTPLIPCHIKARALLQPFRLFHHAIPIDVRTQVPVSAHPATWEILLQRPYQRTHRILLLFGPGICRQPLRIQSPFISDADAFTVIPPCMRSFPFQRPRTPDVPVLADIEMIAHHAHPLQPVTPQQVLLRKVDVNTRSGAMHHYQRNITLHATQAVTPCAPAMPDATAMITL